MMTEDELDDAINPYAGPIGVHEDEVRWSRRSSLAVIVLLSLGLWALIWLALSNFT